MSLNLFASESLVGSFALFHIESPTFKGMRKIELVKFNSADDTFSQVTTSTKESGDIEIVEERVAIEDINTQEENKMILSLCESDLSGTKQKVTVKAGTFETCILKDDDSVFYFANVPFGYIRSISRAQKVELHNFSF